VVAGFKNLAHIERVVADPDHSWLPAAAVGVAARTAGETVPVWRQSGRGIHVDAPPRRNGRIDPPTGHCACQEVDGARGRPPVRASPPTLERRTRQDWSRRRLALRERGARTVPALRGDGGPSERATGPAELVLSDTEHRHRFPHRGLRENPTGRQNVVAGDPPSRDSRPVFRLVVPRSKLPTPEQREISSRGRLEERLPASPFCRAEWWALGERTDRARYWPLSHIEQWIPVLFALTYFAGFLAFVLA